jgi:hypothetical protein
VREGLISTLYQHPFTASKSLESLQMLVGCLGLCETKLGNLSNQQPNNVRPKQMFSCLLGIHPKIVKEIPAYSLGAALNDLIFGI